MSTDRLVLDAFRFASPPFASLQTIEKYISQLQELFLLQSDGLFRYYVASSFESALRESGSHPFSANLEQTLLANGNRTYQPGDVGRLLTGIAKRSTVIEEEFGLEDFLQSNETLRPDAWLASRPPMFLAHLYALCATIAMYHVCKQSESDEAVLTAASGAGPQQSMFSSDIDAVVPDELLPPQTVAQNLTFLSNSQDLLAMVDPVALWQKADEDNAYRIAFAAYLCH